MLLAVDIGNTTITLGLYDGETPGPRWRLETVRSRLPDEYGLTLLALLANAGLSKGDISAAALSSVVPPRHSITQHKRTGKKVVCPLKIVILQCS